MDKRYRNLALAGTLLGCMASASALAGGVKYAHIEPDPTVYVNGPSDTIYVHSTWDAVAGDYVFTHIETNSYDGMVAFGTKVEAKCSLTHRLKSAVVDFGTDLYWGDPDDIPSGTKIASVNGQSLEVNQSNRYLPWRHVDYDVPIDAVEDELFPLAGSDFFTAGENYIAQEVALGQIEEDVRLAGFIKVINVPINFHVICYQPAWPNDMVGSDSTLIPLKVHYLPPDEVAPLAPALPEANSVQVNQADLVVAQDEQTCSVYLSIMFTTNGVTNIKYHIVNNTGFKSQLIQIPVGQTYTELVGHEIDVAPPEPDGFGYTPPNEGHDDIIDDWAPAETDHNAQGWFQIEVVYPHYKLSNIDGYSMVCSNAESTRNSRD